MDDSSNFNSISPSAMSLFEARSFTSIPFAKESFKIISQFKTNEIKDEIQLPKESFKISQFKTNESKKGFQLPREILFRIMHFETRYLSIDKGLRELGYNKILEFASGFSFRGLDFCDNPNIQYIDTDLPNIIEMKKKLLAELTSRYCDYRPTNLILKSMNVLNDEEFFDSISIFKTGPLSIVNEGLLIYLNLEQKKTLCRIIHKILSQYGGCWITADVYLKDEIERKILDKHYKQIDKEFVEKHNIENNKFISFEDAKEFFSSCGFEIIKKIVVEETELSSNKLLHENSPSKMTESQGNGKSRETWILRPKKILVS